MSSIKTFAADIGCEFRITRVLVVLGTAFILLSFSIYLFFDSETAANLGKEDGFFESLTAVFFLAASVVLVRSFFIKKNWLILLLALVFFAGMGEEISWGQRIFGFATPTAMKQLNVQEEFNIHNLVPLNSDRMNGTYKYGLSRVFTVNFLFKVFWLGFGIVLPLGVRLGGWVRRIAARFKWPVPPLTIGVLFLLNYLIVKVLQLALDGSGTFQFRDTGGEIYECGTALIFFLISLYFLRMAARGRVEQSQAAAVPASGTGPA